MIKSYHPRYAIAASIGRYKASITDDEGVLTLVYLENTGLLPPPLKKGGGGVNIKIKNKTKKQVTKSYHPRYATAANIRPYETHATDDEDVLTLVYLKKLEEIRPPPPKKNRREGLCFTISHPRAPLLRVFLQPPTRKPCYRDAVYITSISRSASCARPQAINIQ